MQYTYIYVNIKTGAQEQWAISSHIREVVTTMHCEVKDAIESALDAIDGMTGDRNISEGVNKLACKLIALSRGADGETRRPAVIKADYAYSDPKYVSVLDEILARKSQKARDAYRLIIHEALIAEYGERDFVRVSLPSRRVVYQIK